jgi:hypothetical protein
MRFNSPAWDLGAAEIVRPRTRDFVDTCQLAEVIATRTRLTWSFAYIEKAQSENEDYTLKEDSGFRNLSEAPGVQEHFVDSCQQARGLREGSPLGNCRRRGENENPEKVRYPRGGSGVTISAI